MGQRGMSLAQGEFYHIYNRGTEKRNIFLDAADYERFVELLFLCNSKQAINVRDIRNNQKSIFDFNRKESIVAIGAYCLMPNHFHILLSPQCPDGVKTFMGKVGTSYSMYFNKRYERTGSLFQGRYRAEHANHDNYLKYLFSYIHLNPVKLIQPDWKEQGIIDGKAAYEYVSAYPYSSLSDYLGPGRDEAKILTRQAFPDYFNSVAMHGEEVISWLTYKSFSLGRS